VATGFGAGYVPAAPGTAGSLVGLVLVFLLHNRSTLLYAAVLLAVFALGVYTSGRFERATGEKDSGRIVVDEIAGMLVVFFLVPPGPAFWIGGFVLFRALDIWKPFPARWVERNIPGGWGVMLDDTVAGLYANLILQSVNALAVPS
jgi:phosphatidylglycerophosphatase A